MNRRKMTRSQYYAAKRKQRDKENEAKKHIAKTIEEYKGLASSNIQSLAKYPDIIVYLREKFPSIDIDYENVDITFAPPYRMKRDFPGAGGFFFPDLKELVISGDTTLRRNDYCKRILESCLQDDEVVLHEMLHFVSREISSMKTSSEYEEEFAYTNTIPYLRKKGYSDSKIIENYLMAYCVQGVLPQVLREMKQPKLEGQKLKVFIDKNENIIYSKAFDFGLKMITEYDVRNNNVHDNEEKEHVGRFSTLEL